MQDHPLRLELLGTPLLDTSSISSSTTQKAIRLNNPALLFLYLAYRNDWVSRSELAFLFRPDETELVALKHLRLQLHRAKKLPWFLDIEAVEATCFEADKERMRLSVLTDVDEFKTAIVAEE